MTGKQAILLGCGAAAAFAGVVAIAFVAWVSHVVQDPPGVRVWVEGPMTVEVGEEFTLVVVVQNEREAENFELSDIDFADEYLSNFLLLGTDPRPRSSMHVPIGDIRSFSFGMDIRPRKTVRFAFTLSPTAAGLFRGDVDVYEGQQLITTLVETQVTPRH